MNGTTVFGYNGDDTNIIIPNDVKYIQRLGYTDSNIHHETADYSDTTITIPASVTRIDEGFCISSKSKNNYSRSC